MPPTMSITKIPRPSSTLNSVGCAKPFPWTDRAPANAPIAEPDTNIVSRSRIVGTPRRGSPPSAGHASRSPHVSPASAPTRCRPAWRPRAHTRYTQNRLRWLVAALSALRRRVPAEEFDRPHGHGARHRSDARELVPLGDDLADDLAQRQGRDREEEQVRLACHPREGERDDAGHRDAERDRDDPVDALDGSPTPRCSRRPSRTRPARTRTAPRGRTRSRSRRPEM